MDSVRSFVRTHDTLKTMLVAFTTTAGLLVAAWGYVSQIATDSEIAAALNIHDHGSELASSRPGVTHPVLSDRITAVETVVTQHGALTAAHQEEVFALWKRMVRFAAADQEPDARLRMAAANFYEDEFERVVATGMAPNKAFLTALHAVWHARPKVE